MIISVNRAEKGANGTKSAVSEIFEEFGIRVHSIVNVYDIFEYMKNSEAYAKYASLMESYMDRYCEKL
ncbi:hypothetical protein SDC9_117806 [bioreactor metagenome]|uniref:Orotate phosphoribosyltransferase n=1 Tax=bioreactor metagenome TaxID=1076179 RepID=A0A645BZZ7_9ZZZZ